jgi:4-amino-4-deoxy-L-arabinose transferase-like glycosyltransferase
MGNNRSVSKGWTVMARRALWALIFGFAAFHVLLAALIPLVEDEAYYELWATVPSAGYYDHPPFVAWGIWAGKLVLGDTGLAVRAASILAMALTTLLTWRMARVLSGSETVALRAALLWCATIPMAVFAFAATPDPWSVLFWTATLWAIAEARASGRAGYWLVGGVAAGLGVLSKFTNLFLGVSIVLWLVASREGRVHLRTWPIWLAAGLGLLVLVPFARWNMAHDWIGLERQFGRVGANGGDATVLRYGLFLGSIAVLAGPLTLWFALRALVLRRVPAFLVWSVAPIVLYLLWHATKNVAGGQWLVPIFPTLAIMAALAGPSRGWFRTSLVTGWTLAALVLVAGYYPGRIVIGGQNPFTQWRGWDPVAAEIRTRMAETGAVWIATDAYGLTGQLHHHLGAEVPVWSVTNPERYLFRGPLPAALCDAPALFISRTEFWDGVPYFETRTAGAPIVRAEGGREIMRYHTALVSGLRGCD